jgi:outer membrane protein TolC
MSRRFLLFGAITATALVVFAGCRPQQPFYFFEDGDLSHYKGVATEIEFPDVQSESLGEVNGAQRPFSLENQEAREFWDLTLEEAVRIALTNGKVMRSIGGQIQGPPDFLLRNPDQSPTIYDPAVIESNPRFGVEAALAAFDAQYHSLVKWERFHEPLNSQLVQIPFTEQDIRLQTRNDYNMTFQNRLQKTTATGGTFALSHDFINSSSTTQPLRIYHMDWTAQLRAEMRQPLLQGAGVQFNRIAGPGAIPGFNNGVMLARINTDIALHDFEASVRNLVSDVEIAYWELYFTYRSLDAVKKGRDAGAQTWKEINAKLGVGAAAMHEEAQARQQYFLFKLNMERALTALYQAESKLRYMLGLAATDGRLIRPKGEPTTAKMPFDWTEFHAEALVRNVELRKQRWTIKRRDLELIAAKNYLLPKLDAFAMYQWYGVGNLLLEPNGGTGDFRQIGSNAYQNLTSGEFQDWNVGLELTVPLGSRKETSGVRNAQLALARERARLQEMELELSHQLAWALREMESNLVVTQTAFSRRVAAEAEVRAAKARLEVGAGSTSGRFGEQGVTGGKGTLSDLLDAQRRLAEAEAEYYRALIDYNKSISQVHFRKGSLLEYNGVYLAEGSWPAKAYFDACRRARARDASIYLDYGFTQPKVISRGPYAQQAGEGPVLLDESIDSGVPAEVKPEPVPAPTPTPASTPRPLSPPTEPVLPNPQADSPGTGVGLREPSQGAGAWLAPQQAAAKRAGNARDVASLDLRALAGKAEKRGPQPGAGRPAAVKQVGYQESGPRTKSETLEGTDTRRSGLRWSVVEGSGRKDESVANPPPAEADRPASGWKKLER